MERPADCILETERLWLCCPDPERDLCGWSETMGDETNVRYIGGRTLDRAGSWRQMATVVGHWSICGYGFMSCILKTTGEHVGRVGPWNPLGWPEPEVGWTLHPAHHGRGYATEAGQASIGHAFGTLGWAKVVHVIAHGNTASAKLAERLGSRHLYDIDGIEGLPGSPPCWVYGQTRGEWETRAPGS